MFRNLTPIVRALLYVNFIVYGLEWLTGERLLAPMQQKPPPWVSTGFIGS
jgi:hypothetical protein